LLYERELYAKVRLKNYGKKHFPQNSLVSFNVRLGGIIQKYKQKRLRGKPRSLV